MSVSTLLRRAGVAASIAAACAAAHAHAHGDEAAAAARLPQRTELLARAQAELERGDAAQALDDFERAAMMLHAADAELGLIRAAMQDGQYRRALAFCAHTAGEHTDDADGGALYAWLLRIGGQGELAAQVLADTRAHVPDDAVAAAVARAFAATPPIASGVLLQPPHRMAPWPVVIDSRSSPPQTARFVSNGVLVDDGSAALVPLPLLDGAAGMRLWVRNGLGQVSEAKLAHGGGDLASRGLARLELRWPLPVGASLQATGRAPFAGSPGFSLQFGDGSGPAWPMLTQGFLGTLVGDTGVRKLGFASPPGAAVLDARGMLIGVTLASTGGPATWLPVPSTAPSQAASAPTPPAHAGPALTAPDEIYETGLRRALQVLAAPPP
ncbi:MAG: hypothetical protein ACJ8GJ_07950 [Vitreoscilla sp.]